MRNDRSPLFVYSRFNFSLHGPPPDDAWVARRIDVYRRYTLHSLARQTDGDFTIWLDCREHTQEQLAPYLPSLTQAGVVVTFDRGRALLASLPNRCSHFYITRIDSDDMYGPDAIKQIRRLHGAARASQFYRGYIHDIFTNSIARIMLPSPPFYTLRFQRGEIVSAECVDEMLQFNGRRGHNTVRALFNPVPLPHGRFCIVRHDQNSGTLSARRQLVTSPLALDEITARFALPAEREGSVMCPKPPRAD